MALRAFLLLFVTILLVSTMVSSQDDPEEELKAKRRVTFKPTPPKAKTPPKARSPPAPKGGKGGKTKPFPKSPPSPALDEPSPPFDEHHGEELTPPLPVANKLKVDGMVNPLNKSVSSIGN